MAALIVCICISSFRFLLLVMLAPRHLKVTGLDAFIPPVCNASIPWQNYFLYAMKILYIYIYIFCVI